MTGAERTGRGWSAAVDIGTNSVRVAVLDADGRRLARRMRITRLGAGVDRTGRLDPAAVERTLAAVVGCREVWDAYRVDPRRIRIGATSAIRDAADRRGFLAAVEDATGVSPEVLSGEEEAATAFLGAVRSLDVAGTVAVLDVGGGSTELIVGGADGRVAGSCSMQLGSVRLTERLLVDDPPTSWQVAEARREVRERLAGADDRLAAAAVDVRDAEVLIGVAGTVTTLASLHLGLDRYDEDRNHHTVLPAADVTAWAERLAALPSSERAGLGPVQAGREDVIAGGALIVDEVLQRYGFDGIVVSEADILDGLALTAAAGS